MIVPILYSQAEVVMLINGRLQNANSRWSDAQIYSSLNMALLEWHGKVAIPFVYTIPGGWVNGTYSYDLPTYIEGPLDPQSLYYTDQWPFPTMLSTDQSTWRDLQAFSVEPNTEGGQTLRLHYFSPSMDGRVIYWIFNGPVPTTAPTLASSITSTDTSLTIDAVPTIGRNGYVKIESEWIQYAGCTPGASMLTLTNLVRGANGTTAASHNSAVTVYWGVAMDNGRLLTQLMDQTRGFLMEHNLMNDSSQENESYEKMLLLYNQRAMNFWKTYKPARAPKMRLSRMGIGI